MDTWGLNYCILTRVPQLDKIAFINLPDYGRHMKLFNKVKGKNFFKMFLSFNKKSYNEFAAFVKHVAKINLDILSTLSTNILLPNSIDFHLLHMSSENSRTAHDQGSRTLPSHENQTPDPQQKPDPKIVPGGQKQNKRGQPAKPSKQNKPVPPKQSSNQSRSSTPQYNLTVMTMPRFDNPPSKNNCWANSVLQILNQAVKCRGDSPDIPNDQIRQELVRHGNVLMTELQKFQQPGLYSVDDYPEGYPRASLKQLILFAMEIGSPQELNRQHDAAEGIQAILGMTRGLSFLWHKVQETIRCETCGYSSMSSPPPNSVASVDISTMIHLNTFDAARAIKSYFESEERGVEWTCPICHNQTGTKSMMMLTPSRFVVVQLKRFMNQPQRHHTSPCKINAEALPFDTLDIETGQGICTYKVIATVHHIGTQLTQGHYVAYVKQGNEWIMCDDQRIIPCGETSSDPVRNAYLLLLQFSDD